MTIYDFFYNNFTTLSVTFIYNLYIFESPYNSSLHSEKLIMFVLIHIVNSLY
ncbi:hypothetical protein C1646_710534 [Rhizophagus diaphanus]|nr:hypothetical protein C1646_710534 [Rhizophagus diaphanus] [Rhizophagus sp. MUCL 43196]